MLNAKINICHDRKYAHIDQNLLKKDWKHQPCNYDTERIAKIMVTLIDQYIIDTYIKMLMSEKKREKLTPEKIERLVKRERRKLLNQVRAVGVESDYLYSEETSNMYSENWHEWHPDMSWNDWMIFKYWEDKDFPISNS